MFVFPDTRESMHDREMNLLPSSETSPGTFRHVWSRKGLAGALQHDRRDQPSARRTTKRRYR